MSEAEKLWHIIQLSKVWLSHTDLTQSFSYHGNVPKQWNL